MSKSLVLVVGAGASKEVNLPVGEELKHRIAHALDIRYEDGYQRTSGDATIDAAFREIVQGLKLPNIDINQYLESSWQIRDAMSQAISIDNFIDSHRDDHKIATCGKLAIARCILSAESESSLFINPREREQKINFSDTQGTWFNSFFQLLAENCSAAEIKSRLGRVVIITFNYDRCIEHYLFYALQNYYKISPAQAAETLLSLKIFHPYGSVGPLPWQQRIGGLGFGASVNASTLVDASRAIRTFTEGVNPEQSDIETIRAVLDDADRVAFLGFAFHRLNIQLLFPGSVDGQKRLNRPMFATGVGISDSDAREIGMELAGLGAVDVNRFQIRGDLTCAGLFREYRRSLGLS